MQRSTWCGRVGVVVGLLMLSPFGSVAAQASPDPGFRNVFAFAPLGVMFQHYTVEVERVIMAGATLGASASFVETDRDQALGEVKLRFYLNERAPDGFSVGVSAGASHYGRAERIFAPRAQTRATVSVIVDHNVILDAERRLLLGFGVGAKRVLGPGGADGIEKFRTTARLVLGVRY